MTIILNIIYTKLKIKSCTKNTIFFKRQLKLPDVQNGIANAAQRYRIYAAHRGTVVIPNKKIIIVYNLFFSLSYRAC
jgi:Fe2+ transport system protein B